MSFKIVRCPSEGDVFLNCLHIHPLDMEDLFAAAACTTADENGERKVYAEVVHGHNKYALLIHENAYLKRKCVAFSGLHRSWIGVGNGGCIDINLLDREHLLPISSLVMEVDYLHKTDENDVHPFHVRTMKSLFLSSCYFLPQVVGHPTILQMKSQPDLCLTVKEMTVEEKGDTQCSHTAVGFINSSSSVAFVRKDHSRISISGIAMENKPEEIFRKVWSFVELGVGGLDAELSDIYRRTFVSRMFPSALIKEIGMKHVKGILLYGPSGTGKTLVAKAISGMGNEGAHVEMLNMHVETSQQKLVEFFKAAEKSEATRGGKSPLHVLVLDEIAAICTEQSHGRHGQQRHEAFDLLLTKMDSDNALNNILIIGTTTRKDLVDEALMRPNRFDVHMETKLPDEEARCQILTIHTRKLRESGKLSQDVDLNELAQSTVNFTGAELEKLVQSACTESMNRLVQSEGHIVNQPSAAHDLCFLENSAAYQLKVEQKDFVYAIEQEIIPKYGVQKQESALDHVFINYGPSIDDALSKASFLLNQLKLEQTNFIVSLLLRGAMGSGKSATAVQIAYKMSECAHVAVCSSQVLIGLPVHNRCVILRELFSAAFVSPSSCIVLEDIEQMIGYLPHNGTVSYEPVLHTLTLLLRTRAKRGHKLFIIATTSMSDGDLSKLQLSNIFSEVVTVPLICDEGSVVAILQALQSSTTTALGKPVFTRKELETITMAISELGSFKLSMKQLVRLYNMYVGDGKEKNIDSFVCWVKKECELETLF